MFFVCFQNCLEVLQKCLVTSSTLLSSMMRYEQRSDVNMAAGIVASTLRRRTFRHKVTLEARYQVIEPGHISLSPTGSHPPSRSPSFLRADLSRTPSAASGNCIPKGTRLLYHDFWPKCSNSSEQNLKLLNFDTFE